MTNTFQQTVQNVPPKGWTNAVATLNASSVAAWTQTQSGDGARWMQTGTSLPVWLNDREDREAYLESCLEQDVAWQIRLNREERGMSQKELAEMVGTKQSSIARAEDPTYGKHSLAMLVKIAHAFRCALLVRFVGYTNFLAQTADTSAEALTVPSDE